MKQEFFICQHCGNVIAKVKDAGVPIICCGDVMDLIVPGSVDASVEKHVPTVVVEGNVVTVAVGSVEHPMVNEHYIEWISIESEQGNQRKVIVPGNKPEAKFALVDGDKVKTAYAYCNLHGLWKKEI